MFPFERVLHAGSPVSGYSWGVRKNGSGPPAAHAIKGSDYAQIPSQSLLRAHLRHLSAGGTGLRESQSPKAGLHGARQSQTQRPGTSSKTARRGQRDTDDGRSAAASGTTPIRHQSSQPQSKGLPSYPPGFQGLQRNKHTCASRTSAMKTIRESECDFQLRQALP